MSLYGLSKDVETLLHAKKFPLRVYYGPERTAREGYPENVIVFERDTEGSDEVREPRGVQRNPRKMRARYLASVLHIYAKNSVAGARIQDHHQLCDKFADAVLVAIEKWATGSGAIDVPITESKYLSAQERLDAARLHAPGVKADAIEQWPGVVYRIKFQVPRALLDLDYSGQGLPTTTLAARTNTTEAYPPQANPPDFDAGDPDTACGG